MSKRPLKTFEEIHHAWKEMKSFCVGDIVQSQSDKATFRSPSDEYGITDVFVPKNSYLVLLSTAVPGNISLNSEHCDCLVWFALSPIGLVWIRVIYPNVTSFSIVDGFLYKNV